MFCVVCMERYLDGRGKIYRLGAQECGTLKFEGMHQTHKL